MADTSVQVSEEILSMCRRLMGGSWSNTSFPIHVQPISQGQTNQLFILRLKQQDTDHSSHSSTLPHTVILRLFADIWTQDDVITQNIVYTILSERGIAPRLYGMLPHSQGRIEHFYQCRTLTNPELYRPEVIRHACRIVADIHRQEMPLPKEASFVFGCMRRWLKQCGSIRLSDPGRQERLNGMLSERKWDQELDWLEQHLKHLNHPIVFCHNDVYSQNIIKILDKSEFQIEIIDYECSSYNYRAYEWAQLFHDFMFDFDCPEHPGFKFSPESYPSLELRKEISKTYLEYFHRAAVEKEDVERLIVEIQDMRLYSNLFVLLWGLKTCAENVIVFDSLSFAEVHLSLYNSEKNRHLHTSNVKAK